MGNLFSKRNKTPIVLTRKGSEKPGRRGSSVTQCSIPPQVSSLFDKRIEAMQAVRTDNASKSPTTQTLPTETGIRTEMLYRSAHEDSGTESSKDFVKQNGNISALPRLPDIFESVTWPSPSCEIDTGVSLSKCTKKFKRSNKVHPSTHEQCHTESTKGFTQLIVKSAHKSIPDSSEFILSTISSYETDSTISLSVCTDTESDPDNTFTNENSVDSLNEEILTHRDKSSIKVTNLSPKTDPSDLLSLMHGAVAVTDFHYEVNPVTKFPARCTYVLFDSEATAKKARESLHGKILNRHAMLCEFRRISPD